MKKINIQPFNFRNLLFCYKRIIKYIILLFVILLFVICYNLSFGLFSNSYVFDKFIYGDGYAKICLPVDNENHDLFKLLAELYKSDTNVVPVFFQNMPDIRSIHNLEKRKYIYINIVLPIILKVYKDVLYDKGVIDNINSKLQTEPLNEEDFINIQELANKYFVKLQGNAFWDYSRALEELLLIVDVIPISLTLAMSIEETGWGNSRFLYKGQSLFSEWIWAKDGEGIKPQFSNSDLYSVRIFSTLESALRSFFFNINTNVAYKQFREKRYTLRKQNKELDAFKLVPYISNYSEDHANYAGRIRSIIVDNNLKQYDHVIFSDRYQPVCLKYYD